MTEIAYLAYVLQDEGPRWNGLLREQAKPLASSAAHRHLRVPFPAEILVAAGVLARAMGWVALDEELPVDARRSAARGADPRGEIDAGHDAVTDHDVVRVLDVALAVRVDVLGHFEPDLGTRVGLPVVVVRFCLALRRGYH